MFIEKNSITKSIWYLKYFGDAEATIRYFFCFKLLKSKLNLAKLYTVVDFGGGSRTIYPEFCELISTDKIKLTSVDTVFNSKIKNEKVIYLTPKELTKEQYDLGICLDTLEHIPPEKRNDFISELDVRVTKTLILAFPCDVKAAKQDLLLHNIYKQKYGVSHKFLQEHVDYNLPNFTEVEGYFLSKNYKVKTYKQMNLTYRKLFMYLWIKTPKLFRLLSPFIVFLGQFTNFGNCYRKYLVIEK
ncbi:hypothetical protein KA001_00670 [Patescibacteria group bacterium]|nr:hypothetical protein [Patescibacteria group bacterium]